jgi:hypothetical protein
VEFSRNLYEGDPHEEIEIFRQPDDGHTQAGRGWQPSIRAVWRAVDQDGEVVDVYLQRKRDGAAAKRFFKRLLRSHGGEPRKIVTDKLRSYGVARHPGGSNQWGRRRDSWVPMQPSQIYSI